MKKMGIVAGGVIVVVGIVFWWSRAPRVPVISAGTDGLAGPANPVGSAGQPSRTNHMGRGAVDWLDLDAYTKLTAREKPFVQKMQDALDEEDLEGVIEAANVLMTSESVDARRDTVWALGWFGVQALPQLAQMLGDPEEDIAKTAAFHFEGGVRDVMDDQLKADLLEAAFLTVKDRDDLESLAMLFNELPDSLAVRQLVSIIESGNLLAGSVARDQYAFITGEEYTSRDDAEKWIAENPDTDDAGAEEVLGHEEILQQLQM
ncbi:MAG: hypothetical protein FWH21_05370 [Kiritimatiellaeota bacterium]|nr:hypothetical protein [Kiritimatiellota bacterium]